jgi:hypothetical protein
MHCIDQLGLHSSFIFSGLEWILSTEVADEVGKLLLLLQLDMQHPHEISSPADSAIQNIAFVWTFVFFFDGYACSDITSRSPPGTWASKT